MVNILISVLARLCECVVGDRLTVCVAGVCCTALCTARCTVLTGGNIGRWSAESPSHNLLLLLLPPHSVALMLSLSLCLSQLSHIFTLDLQCFLMILTPEVTHLVG